nr:MAG TPA: hypothetical protein [Caudoviricetes sp.]
MIDVDLEREREYKLPQRKIHDSRRHSLKIER